MLNVVTLVGRLSADPVLKSIGDNISVANFTIAVNNRTADKSASFINCVAFRQTADVINKFTKKGSLIGISGYLQQRTWEKDNQKRSVIEVVAERVALLDTKERSEGSILKTNNNESSVNTIENLDDDSDLPF